MCNNMERNSRCNDPRISASIIGDLIIAANVPDGVPRWPAGICEVIYRDGKVVVEGENGHSVSSPIALEDYQRDPTDFERKAMGIEEQQTDLQAVAEKVNEEIAWEYSQL